MNYHDLPEWPAFLAAIRAAPDDDLPRLVAADWLDELETEEAAERAEFIRIQVEQWNSGGDTTALTRRAVALTRRNKAKWLHPLRPMEPRESGLVGQYTVGDGNYTMRVICSANDQTATDREAIRCEFTRGFLRLVSAPLGVLHGGECGRCGGVGHLDLYSCPGCYLSPVGTGRTPGVLGELLRREPITAAGIVVTDREPHPNSYGGTVCGWQSEADDPVMARAASHVPYTLLRAMAELDGDDLDGRTWLTFPTADSARLALGEALYRLHHPTFLAASAAFPSASVR